MPGLPADLYTALRTILLDCEQFSSDRQLRALFAHEWLHPWRHNVPDADTSADRVASVIAFLSERRRSDTGANALVLFLRVIQQQVDSANELYQRLDTIANQLQAIFSPAVTQQPEQSSREPLCLTLQFVQRPEGTIIRWESDATGIAESTFLSPFSDEDLPVVIKALDALQHPDYPHSTPTFSDKEQSTLTRLNLWEHGRIVDQAHHRVGTRLYEALTGQTTGYTSLRTVRAIAQNQDQSVRYILRFPPDAVSLAALPWEAMRDERQALLLSRGGQNLDSCERQLDLSEALSPPLRQGHRLHMLALAPNAGIPASVRHEEQQARFKSWASLQKQGLVEWDELTPLTMARLDDRLRHGPRPDIVHYYGHGIYRDGYGYLLFDSPTNTNTNELVRVDRLSALLGGIRLIVIHACQSAMVGDTLVSNGLLTGIAPALSAISEAVVAMQLTIRINAATRFTEVLYTELARGRSLQMAVADARRSLYVIEPDSASWYVPTLYIRSRDQRSRYFVQP